MNFTIILAALKSAVMTAVASIGASFLSGLSVIGQGFSNDERAIGAKVQQKFHDVMDAALAAGKSEIDAIEEGATAAYNEFCHDEVTEFKAEASAIITLLASSLKSAAGLK